MSKIKKFVITTLLLLILTPLLPKVIVSAEEKSYRSPIGNSVISNDFVLASSLTKEKKDEGTMKVYELIQKYLDPEYVKLRYHDSIAHSDGYDPVGYYDVSESDYKELQDIAKNLTKNCKTDYDKIVTLAKAIAERVYYDNEYLSGNKKSTPWQPLEVWNEKRTTCIGYSMLYLIMADSLDIPCMRMHTQGHVYNLAYSYSEKRWIIVDTMQAAIPKEITEDGVWKGSDTIIEAWIDADPKRLCSANQSIEYVEGFLIDNMYYRLDTGWSFYNYNKENWGLQPLENWIFEPIGKKDSNKDGKIKTYIEGIRVADTADHVEASDSLKKKIKKAIKKMKFKASDSTFYKVKKVHDWLIYNFDGDILFGDWYSGNYSDYTDEMIKEAKSHRPYDLDWAFENRLANCHAYSSFFKLFMDELGIECKYVTSTLMNHAWNVVKMDDGCWYHVDVLWDDPHDDDADPELGCYSNRYFLRTDEDFPDHYGWYGAAPKCEGEYYDKPAIHSVTLIRTSKDKYYKNGNIKVSYGDRAYSTNSVTRFYKNGMAKSEKYIENSSGQTVTKKYDKKGNLTKISRVEPDGDATEYNSNGNLIMQKLVSSDGTYVVYKGCFVNYGDDPNGEYIQYNADGTVLFYYKGGIVDFMWNGNGIAKYYYGENNTLSFEYEGEFKDYYRQGKGVYKDYYSNGKLKTKYDGEFDKGDLIKGTVYVYHENGDFWYSYEK